MNKNKIIRFVHSLVIIPMLATSIPFGGLRVDLAPNKSVVEESSIEIGLVLKETKAAAIDAYFEKYNMPLKGKGMKMVEEAEKNEIDWRLLAAISVRESTGGKYACKKATNNPFGWGSCKIGFETMDQAIETVARNLGGNNPRTAYHYEDKTTREILNAYNPPSIIPKYTDQVIAIMNSIGEENFTLALVETNS
jgi:hypothetical protein